MQKFIKYWPIFLGLLLAVTVLLFGIREYQTRSLHTFDGVITPCRYADADRECSFITTFESERYLLTDGSMEELKKVTTNNFYGRRVKLFAKVSRQRINVRDVGELIRIQVEKFEFFN